MAPRQPIFITAGRHGELSHRGTGFSTGPLAQRWLKATARKTQKVAVLSYISRLQLFKALQNTICSPFG
jgi:hypothetical protein